MRSSVKKTPSFLSLVLAFVVSLSVAFAPSLALAEDDDEDDTTTVTTETTDEETEDTDESEDSDETSDSEYSADEEPEVEASVALLVELNTGTVLYSLEADTQAYPASITKVMTALLVLENGDLDDEVTMEDADFDELTWDASTAGLEVGETLTVRDLLYCMLLPSGNEAAYALARYVSGDWETFVELMNERAAELGCTGTNFTNPCGLPDEDHYTTANDLLLIFEEALTYDAFCEVASSATYELSATNLQDARTLESSNLLVDTDSSVYTEGVLAGKTGYTSDAGRCLIVAVESGDMTLVGIVLGSPDETDDDGVAQSFYDMTTLLDWGFGAWTTEYVVEVDDTMGSVAVELSKDGDYVDAVATSSLLATVPVGTTFEDLTIDLGVDEALVAAVEEGYDLGSATVYLGDRELGTVSIVTDSEMRLSIPAYILDWLSEPVHAVIAAVVFIGILVILSVISNYSRRNKKARERERARMTRYDQNYYGQDFNRSQNYVQTPTNQNYRGTSRTGSSGSSRSSSRTSSSSSNRSSNSSSGQGSNRTSSGSSSSGSSSSSRSSSSDQNYTQRHLKQ